MNIHYSKYNIFTKSQVHKHAQLRQRLSTARYYESVMQIQNGVNTTAPHKFC